MKTLIVYATRHGCTETCSEKLKSQIPGGADLVNLKRNADAPVEHYDTVLIGGSIHAGRIQKSVKKFCEKREAALLQKKIGLFLCCMEEGDKAKTQFETAFPASMRDRASARGLFGGEFNFERMNWVERAIVEKIAKTERSISKISGEKISRFISDLNG
jgi:menaquinone-dependent protoporphyrinogen oxidase